MKGFDCFLRDMVAGTTIRASVTSTGGQIEGPEYGDVGQSFCTAISPSGRYVSFQSYEQVVPDVPRGHTFALMVGLDPGTGGTAAARSGTAAADPCRRPFRRPRNSADRAVIRD